MESDDILSVLRRYSPLIIAHMFFGMVIGFVIAAVTPPVYTSTATALVAAETENGTQSLSSTSSLISAVVPTLVDLGTSDQVLEEVAASTGLPVSQLQHAITVETTEGSLIIAVTATASTPALAQEIAEAEMESLRERVGGLTVRTQDESALILADVDLPKEPTAPSAPSRTRFVLYGLILGAALGGSITLALYRMSTARSQAPRESSYPESKPNVPPV